jgi:hypothetical protein
VPDLAKLDLDPSARRGLDVVHRVSVPRDWLERGASIECQLPRRLACAGCDGSGCDTCGLRGAVVMHDVTESPRSVTVHLAVGTGEPRALRLLDEGCAHAEEGVPRGCLILRIQPGEASAGVRRLGGGSAGRFRLGAAVLLGLGLILLLAMLLWH